ncbi:MAG: acetyl-CoA carboxylase biotin carboxylase subunit [Rickettsiales bacterium]|nr:acetyl-CoA carboxylase biotin carboxylase subunit [Rickettsiales bacterium]
MTNNKPLFNKVLVANRGEIAVRIIKTLKKLGIKSVAVYSETDTNALHVGLADEAIFIGNSPATDSYLCIEHIISAVRKSGAQAVHPGYGFLSENHEFALALQKEKIAFIGPTAEHIRTMGDKIKAKKVADKAKINTVPGYLGVIANAQKAEKIAKKIGFPVIVKAAAGGGGRGMRVVHTQKDLQDAFISASNEAKNSFSDGRVFIEKYIQNPRHIEIQILADKHKNAVCIGERECSIQRNHQKIIEEAPSPFISEKTRKAMFKQSLRLIKEIGYFSAGTVEFMVDEKQKFYFMEMNTRLQVEHCVTVLIFDLDLVEEMIKIAAGHELSFSQKDLKPNGWAIESRICAEDPSRGFLPSSGRIIQYEEPPRNTQVRVDSGIMEGGEVNMFYDQMIAKLCTHGTNREEAIELMKQALGEYVIAGISHNISFLQAIMENPKFSKGDISTGFIAQEYPEGFSGSEVTSEINQILLATTLFMHMAEIIRAADITGNTQDLIRKVGTRWVVNIDGSAFPIILTSITDGYYIRQGSQRIYVRSNWVIGEPLFRGNVNGVDVVVSVQPDLNSYKLIHSGREVTAYVRSPRIAELEQFMPVAVKAKPQTQLNSTLSGKIVKIFVNTGEKINLGDKLIIIEAMKMENLILGEVETTISKICVKEGDIVSVNDPLFEFET